ncbi:uncharacterized protein klhdc3l isoform 2-T2 [Syngnathus typhle]
MSQNNPCLWSQLPQSISAPCDRYKHACCSYEGNVYILGGRDNSTLRDFWRYSVVGNEWTELSCMGETAPEEVEEHSMVVHKGSIYVFGGTLDSAYTPLRCPLWVFDIETMDWSLLTNLDQGSVSPGPRHSHSAMVYQSCMYLFGGLKGLREQRDFWKWNPATYTWSSLKTKSGPSKLIGHSVVAYKDSMLLFGGGESLNYPKNCLWRYNFSTHTWWQINTMPGSSSPDKMHHCCIGMGPKYTADTTSICSETHPKLQYEKWRSDHNLVHLVADYTPVVKQRPPERRSVILWSEESTARLRDCFENTDWESVCSPHGSDIDSVTHCITDSINFCVETTVPSKLVRCFPYNKPWVSSEIKALLNEKKRAFGLGDVVELRRVQKELRLKIRKGKENYGRRLEKQMELNNSRNIWRGLQSISGHG